MRRDLERRLRNLSKGTTPSNIDKTASPSPNERHTLMRGRSLNMPPQEREVRFLRQEVSNQCRVQDMKPVKQKPTWQTHSTRTLRVLLEVQCSIFGKRQVKAKQKTFIKPINQLLS